MGSKHPFLLSILAVYTATFGCSSSVVSSPTLTQLQDLHRSNGELPKMPLAGVTRPLHQMRQAQHPSLSLRVPWQGQGPFAYSPSVIDHPDSDSLVLCVISDNLPFTWTCKKEN